MRLVPNVNFDTPTIEDSGLVARMSNIVQTWRKKFAFLLGSNSPPPLWFGEIGFQMWKWFRLARFRVFLLVSFLFCFLCGNKIKSLRRLMLTFIFTAYPMQKTFFLWLNLLRFRCTFFSWQWSSRFNSKGFKFLLISQMLYNLWRWLLT